MDTNAKQQALQRIAGATNVLVTVSNNPSVDQLSAAIGFTLLLNKAGKHGTAVFSGQVPSTIEFLKPEDTIEKNTDSLRDFIIALDKSKADKLRYKVEDTYVKIFITPYKTTLGQEDLEFSQGDFNVDVVVAIGVHSREELDQAITAHGRILHDAAVISVNNQAQSDLGAINWNDPEASSLCEMLVGLSDGLQAQSLDGQMATAFLTGIVAETDWFSNQRTTARTMTIAAELLAAGANQQLVASKLDMDTEKEAPKAPPKKAPPKENTNGVLTIDHPEPETTKVAPPKKKEPEQDADPDQIHIDERGTLRYTKDIAKEKELQAQASQNRFRGGMDEAINGRLVTDKTDDSDSPAKETTAIDQKVFSSTTAPQGPSLSEIEKSINKSTSKQPEADNPPPVENARGAVQDAVRKSPEGPLPPRQSTGAGFVHLDQPQPAAPPTVSEPPKTSDNKTPPPPPMPPPMMPPFTPPSKPKGGDTNLNADGTIPNVPL